MSMGTLASRSQPRDCGTGALVSVLRLFMIATLQCSRRRSGSVSASASLDRGGKRRRKGEHGVWGLVGHQALTLTAAALKAS